MDELKKLYDAVSSKVNVGSYDEFSSKMGDKDSRKRFYDVVGTKGISLGDYDAYETRLGGAPKVDTSTKATKEPAEVKKQKAGGSLGSPSASASIDSLLGFEPKVDPRFVDPNKKPEVAPKQEAKTSYAESLDKMPDRGLSIRDKASKSLMKQYEEAGIKEYEITPEEIDEVAVSMLRKPDSETKTNKPKPEYDFWGDTWNKVKSNTATAVAGVAGIPNLINKGLFYALASEEEMVSLNKLSPKARELVIGTSMGAFGDLGLSQASAKVQERYLEVAENLQQDIHQFDRGITEDIMDGNLGRASQRIASEGIGSVPSLVQAMIPYVGIASIVGGSVSNKMEELEEEGYDIDGKSLSNSAINGAAEGLLELVTKKIGSKIYKSIGKVPEQGRKAFIKSIVDNMVKDPLAEGASESATALIQGLSDMYIQGKEKDFNGLIKESLDSGIIGTFVGGSMGLTTSTIQRSQSLLEDVRVNQVINSKSNDFNNVADAFRFEGGSKLSLDQVKLASKVSMSNKLDAQLKKEVSEGKINEVEAASIKLNLVKTQSAISKTMGVSMNDGNRTEAVNLINRKEILKEEFKGLDDALATPKKEEIKKIDEQLLELTKPKKKEATSKVDNVEETVTKEPSKGELEVLQMDKQFTEALESGDELGMSAARDYFEDRMGHNRTLLSHFQKRLKEEQVKDSPNPEALKVYEKNVDLYKSAVNYLKTPATSKDVKEATPEDYSIAMSEALTSMGESDNKVNLQVDPVSLEDAKQIVANGGKLFMTKDGKSGAYVKADGYMGGLFKNPSSDLKEVGKVLQQARTEAGGKYFDAYGTKLEKIYKGNGFIPVARVPFNEEYAPEGWDAPNSPLKDKPDVVFFAYDPNSKVKVGEGEMVTDYDAGIELAKNYTTDEQNKQAATAAEQGAKTGGTGETETGTDTSTSENVTGDKANEDVRQKAKDLAKKIRGLKINETLADATRNLNSAPKAIVDLAWDGTLEVVATTIELSGDLAFAINAGMSHLRASKWYQGLSEKGQKMAERRYKDIFRDEIGSIAADNADKTAWEKAVQQASQMFSDVFTNINEEFGNLKGFDKLYKREGLFESRAANEVDTMLNKVKDAIGNIAKSKFNPKQVSDYLYSKHALERNTYIQENVDEENPFGSGKTDVEARKILEQYTAEEIAELETLSKPFYDIIEDSRNRMVDSGLMSKEAMEAMVKTNEFYVPLTGFADEQITIGENSVQGNKLSVKGKEWKSAGGRTTEAGNIISNIIKQSSDVAMRAAKNELLQEFEVMASKNLDGSLPMEIFTQETLPSSKAVGQNGKVTYRKDGAQSPSNLDYVGFKVNGEQKYIKFDNPILARNLNRATDAQVDGFTKFFGRINRNLSAAFTQYNPEFVLTNFEGDLQVALINLKAQADTNKDLNGQDLSAKALKGLKKAIATIHAVERGKDVDSETSKFYEEFKKEGGKTGWTNRMGLKQINAHVDRVNKMFDLDDSVKGVGKAKIKAQKAVDSFFSVIDDANTSIENGIRLSTYIAARKSGLSALDAASLSKELTVNFNRKGELGTLMNTAFLFFNASVQGAVTFKKNMLTFKTYTNSKGEIKKTLNRGQKIALGAVAISAMLTAYNISMSDDDEESGLSFYESIPDYERERYLIIMSPDGKNHFKIRMPYGYNLFANLGTMFTETTMGNRKVGNAASFMLGSLLGSFNPLPSVEGDIARKLQYTVTPTAASPFAMLSENMDAFGNPAYRENFPMGDQMSSSSLGSNSTSEVYKKTTSFLNSVGGGNKYESSPLDLHPDGLEFLVDYFGGGALKFTKNTVNLGGKLVDKATGSSTKIEARKVPFLSKFYGEDSNFPERNIYYNVKAASEARLNYLDKTEEGKQESDPDRYVLKRLGKAYDESEKKLKLLRKKEKALRSKEDSEEKSEALEELEVKQDTEYSKMVKRYLDYKEQLKGNYED